MGYIGRGQPDRVLTSADIGEGAVTLADISFTDQPANVNITGDYPKQTMRLCDNATVTGDVTIGDGLILAKLASDGDSVTLTSDGTNRTISGTGLIEANTIAQSPNQSLTGMTGGLGSAVTFPTGHIITAESDGSSSGINAVASYLTTYATSDITIKKADSRILILSSAHLFRETAGADIDAKLAYKTSSGRSSTWGDYTEIIEFEAVGGMGGSVGNYYCQPFLCYLWIHGQSAGTLVNVAQGAKAVSGTLYNNSATNSRSQMVLLEIQ